MGNWTSTADRNMTSLQGKPYPKIKNYSDILKEELLNSNINMVQKYNYETSKWVYNCF